MQKKLFLTTLITLMVTACSGSYVGLPGATKSVEGAGTVSLYQLISIYSAQDVASNAVTYTNTCSATGCYNLVKAQTSCQTTCTPLDVFQLVTDQNVADNINKQLTGTISECPSNVTIPPSVDAATIAAAEATAGVSTFSKQIIAVPVTPPPVYPSQYYFLSLGATSAVGLVVDNNFKAVCKMSFTRSDLDVSAVPKKTESLAPESTYDPAQYTFNIQEIPADQLTPDTYKILANGHSGSGHNIYIKKN